jgi:hypothetical protein
LHVSPYPLSNYDTSNSNMCILKLPLEATERKYELLRM